MKLAIFSDLHIEFTTWQPPKEAHEADVIILAGDIHVGKRGIAWISENFSKPVVYVLGNHEYYGNTVQKMNKEIKELTKQTNIHLLIDDAITIDDVCFIGSTLWTDYNLFENKVDSAALAQRKMHDFKKIRFNQGGRYRKITLGDVGRLHSDSKAFIKQSLNKKEGIKTVVVTHHAPSILSLMSEHKEDLLSAAYASNLEEFIINHQPNLWVHGHTHHNIDYKIGDTRVVSNQRGYIPEEPNEAFQPAFIVEI